MLRVQAAQESVAKELTAPAIGAREIYRVSKVLNGIAVAVDPANVRSLQKVRGVKRVLPILMEYPTNSTSVPFLGTPNVWANTIGLPAGADGTGVRIGIIDTGIDYLHPDFGGTGLTATDYMNERPTTANFTTVAPASPSRPPRSSAAPTSRATPTPAATPRCPTPTRWTATATAATSPAPRPASASSRPAPPSPAPTTPTPPPTARCGSARASRRRRSLYAIRVFGCFGGTGLTVQGIDWAMDPNGDNDLSDHLDVINMSLGSDFGSVTNASSVASDNAALAGVIVVTSTGNSSDTFFIASAPASPARG